MIVALAGRRVDKEGQTPARFPATAAELVRGRLRETFISFGASALVSSAAAGADLLALAEAKELGMQRVVVLPWERQEFRSTSVDDRPKEWRNLYDRIMDDVQQLGNLIIATTVAKEFAYVETNHVIINQALAMARETGELAIAVQVWEGRSRGSGDVTEEFGHYAAENGLQVWPVLTT
jgi:hypothetical protein